MEFWMFIYPINLMILLAFERYFLILMWVLTWTKSLFLLGAKQIVVEAFSVSDAWKSPLYKCAWIHDVSCAFSCTDLNMLPFIIRIGANSAFKLYNASSEVPLHIVAQYYESFDLFDIAHFSIFIMISVYPVAFS